MTRRKGKNVVCKWAYNDWIDSWDTSCDHQFMFFNHPKDHGVKFCCYCGLKIKFREVVKKRRGKK